MPVDEICVVTNRDIVGDSFGERTNACGIGEVRVATARVDDEGAVSIKILDESEHDKTLPSEQLFAKYVKELRQSKQNAVLYVHGFNTSFEQSVRDAWDIHQTYNVGVVLFSWPSNPGGIFLREYKKARRAAEASSPAFDNLLEKLGLYLCKEIEKGIESETDCEVSFNLMCFSQGNYLLQRFIESNHYEGETRLFANAILMQADVDSKGHERWATAGARYRAFRRLYVTINESDKILFLSEIVNADRLGSTVENLVSKGVRYLDFTDALDTLGVGRAHGFFKSSIKSMPIPDGSQVRLFFDSALNGRTPEREMQLVRDIESGAWRVS